MKFKFKIQAYQTDAVDAVVKVFNGQKGLPFFEADVELLDDQ